MRRSRNAGNVLLPVLVTVGLGAAVSAMNTYISSNNFKKMDLRTAELVGFPAAEVAAWQSYYHVGANVGTADADGRYPVPLDIDYSKNLPPNLPAAIPRNYVDGMPLNIAQTMEFDTGKTIYSRVSTEAYRYHPAQAVGGSNQNCGYLKSPGKSVGFQECLVRVVPPAACPPGVCTAAITTCIAPIAALTPVIIHSENELLAMQSGNKYELAGDISMTGNSQVTARKLKNLIVDGKGFKIKNLSSYDVPKKMAGLFQTLDCSVIKNLTLEGASISTEIHTGGFLADTISNTAVSNVLLSQGQMLLAQDNPVPKVGGLVGTAKDSVFESVNSGISMQAAPASLFIGQITGGLVGELLGVTSKMTTVRFTGSITAAQIIGGIVGRLDGGTIRKATVTGKLNGNKDNKPLTVGGIVGSFNYGEISESTFSGNIQMGEVVPGQNIAGGIAGHIQPPNSVKVVIKKSISSGDITASSTVGGLVGELASDLSSSVEISECASRGPIINDETLSANVRYFSYAGGIIGRALCSNCLLENVESDSVLTSPKVKSDKLVGGLIGEVQGGTFSNGGKLIIRNSIITGRVSCVGCAAVAADLGLINLSGTSPISISTSQSFFDKTATGQTISRGGFSSRTTSQLQTQSTFTNWDFTSVWVQNVGYPKLRWEP